MLLERLHETFARTCRGEDRMAVLFLDLNGFKPVNDQYGHAAGDAVLRETAARLRKAIRTEDTAARLGGDEFVVLLERAGDPDAAVNVAKRIAGALAAPIQYDELTITVTTSIGVAHLDAGDTAGPPSDAAALLDAADAAMYHAKQTGIGIALHSADGPAAAP
jgi:diguanylate cyclase (GGDEF)-like protein